MVSRKGDCGPRLAAGEILPPFLRLKKDIEFPAGVYNCERRELSVSDGKMSHFFCKFRQQFEEQIKSFPCNLKQR